MASQGPNFPSANNVSTGTGNTWTNPGNGYTSDNTYTTCFVSGAGNTKNLIYSGFGFSIPAGATIDGIVVEFERKTSTASTFIDGDINLIKTGTTFVGTDQSAGATWSTTESYVTFGSSSNLWGTTWTDTEINASSFGVGHRAIQNNSKNSATASIDHVRITVHYTGGGGGPTSASSLLLAGD